jgi:hypothetical protein
VVLGRTMLTPVKSGWCTVLASLHIGNPGAFPAPDNPGWSPARHPSCRRRNLSKPFEILYRSQSLLRPTSFLKLLFRVRINCGF